MLKTKLTSMFQQLINHSPDLKRLRDEGYELAIHGGYLIISHVPYVNNKQEVKYGTLVSQLTLVNQTFAGRPASHTIHFAGEVPCNNDGTVISAITHSNPILAITDKLTANQLFSNKPPNGYQDYYDKFTTYIKILSAPAKSLDEKAIAQTYKAIPAQGEESIFRYVDTSSSRANINAINAKFAGQKIAIVGVGGTGAYIMDMVAKTPVAEIHPFDGDLFLQHNAFRSPGAVSLEILNRQMMKADYYAEIYSNMHKGITPHSYYINDANMYELDRMDYVFICVDKGAVRKKLSDYLAKKGISFIDVGLGVNVVDDRLIGTLRVTTATKEKHDHLFDRLPGADNDDNDYATNIQIADLNAMNAFMAVQKWKKLIGFYVDLTCEHHQSYAITTSKIFNEDTTA
jgi:hypothetical protein